LRVERLPKRLMLHVIVPRMLRMEWVLEAYKEGGKDLLALERSENEILHTGRRDDQRNLDTAFQQGNGKTLQIKLCQEEIQSEGHCLGEGQSVIFTFSIRIMP